METTKFQVCLALLIELLMAPFNYQKTELNGQPKLSG